VRYGNALGHISHVPFEQLYVYSRKELEKFLKVSLAGRAAEEVFLEEELASMKGDMKHIQALIYSMASQGFFKHLPKLDGSFTDDLQAEIETFISEKLKEVKDLLRKNKTLVSRLARELMEREEIIGEEVEELLASWGGGR
jgi:ATP-dependent Zn protease